MSASATTAHRGTTAVLTGMVVLLAALVIIPAVVGLVTHEARVGWTIVCAAVELVLLVAFVVWMHRHVDWFTRPAMRLRPQLVLWLVGFFLPVAGLIVLSPEAAYAAFAFFFVALWLLPPRIGASAVGALAALVVIVQGLVHGWTFGGVVGPAVSALAAIGVMAGYRTLDRALVRNALLLQELRDAQGALVAAEREAGRLAERTRLGRELHDTTAQHLASIRLLLAAAERTENPAEREEVLRRADGAAADAITQTRAVIRELTPPQLAGASLAAALERVAADARTPHFAVQLAVVGTPVPLSMPRETALLRVAQESMANARKHAHAHEVRLRLAYGENAVTLEVSDDGQGFDAEAFFDAPARADGTGLGIRGMQARLAELGGFAAIVAEPGEGTLVRAELPLPTS